MNAVKDKSTSVGAAAASYKVPKSSLLDRVSGRVQVQASIGRKPELPQELEATIARTVKEAADKGFGISPANLRRRTASVIKQTGSDTRFRDGPPVLDWYAGFRKRYPDLALRKPEKLSTSGSRMLNPTVVGNYFTALGDVMEKLNLLHKPAQIWNADESGFQFEHSPVKSTCQEGGQVRQCTNLQ